MTTVAADAGRARALRALATLLEYPDGQLENRLAEALQAADDPGLAPTVAEPLARFAAAMQAMAPARREELHAATFEVTPACVPYVSIHLFGEENYQRGAFMAALRERFHEVGFTGGNELPDHLAVLLRFAAQAGEPEGRELAEFCLLGPLDRMGSGLSESHPYRELLAAIRAAVQAGYPGLEPAPTPVDQMRQHGTGGPGGCSPCAAACHGLVPAEPVDAAAVPAVGG